MMNCLRYCLIGTPGIHLPYQKVQMMRWTCFLLEDSEKPHLQCDPRMNCSHYQTDASEIHQKNLLLHRNTFHFPYILFQNDIRIYLFQNDTRIHLFQH
ncbi:Os02g0566750 [Oryza sativa Japonica Group]|uniref:Os02g0566750 protein n=1 Tax=Oryza sativa subsp. japonica TaxID=39947 RepID=A0A0N7KFI5_ORYSJ|nr:hypothetical protein EE612_011864 [Oryza sativa]BAS79313.1 Os02g0566750 [Oryza sativa Japonica Group]